MPPYLFFVAALLFAAGGLCMKWSDGLTRVLPSIALFVCFCAGAACQAVGMKQWEMGSAYTLVLGLGAVAALGFAMLFLGERLSLAKLGAVAVILVGIALLERA